MKLKKLYSFLTLLTAFLFLGSGSAWAQDPISVLSEDFDNGNFDSNWVRRSYASNTGRYQHGTSGTHSGNYDFKFAYNTNPPQYLVSKTELSIPSNATEVNVSLYYKAGGSYTESFQVGYSTTDNENSSFTWDTQISTSSTSWSHYNNNTFFPKGIKYIAIKYTANDQLSLYIDDIEVTYQPPVTCAKPTSLIIPDDVDKLTTSSAVVTWSKGEAISSILQYKRSTQDWSDAIEATGVASPYTISGLRGGNTYDVRVKNDCGSTDGESSWATESFITPCGIEELPYAEDFDGITSGVPACMNNTEGTVSSATYRSKYYSTGHSGSCVYFDSYYASKNTYSYLKTPEIHITGPAKLTFWYKNPKGGDFSVYYSLDGGTTKAATPLASGLTGKSSWTQSDEISLPEACYNQNVTLCFKGTSNCGSDGQYSNAIFLDDILVVLDVDCGKPATPTYSDLTGSSVTISWAANTGVTDYKYINVDRTANPSYELDWTNDATSISATSVDLTSLTDGHNYEFYVMCACGTVASDACEYTPLSCPTVTGVTLSNQVWDGVTVNWTTSATTNCDVQYKIGEGVWTEYESNISATSKSFSGLVPSTEYSFRVKPHCSADGWVSPAFPYTPTCPTPSALTLSEETYNSVKVSWDAIDGVNTWNLAYKSADDLGWTNVNGITDLFYTIPGMTTNSEYTIQLSTECGGEPYSETTYTPVYAAPTSVLVSAQDLGGDASWAPVEGATGYQYIVVLKDAAQDWSTPATGTTVSSGYVHADPVLSGLHAKTAYDFYVKAVFAGGTSSATKKSFTTSSHAPNTPTVADGDITSSSAVATWTLPAACQATQCQWICKLTSAGAPAVDDAAWSAPTTEFTANISGLDAYTDYTVYVRAYYENGIYSSNATKAFKTKCGTYSIGFSQNFNTSGVVPGCWTCANWASGYSNYWYTAYWSSGNYIAQYQASSTSSGADLVSPSIELSDKATLSFDYTNYYSSRTCGAEVIISNGVTTKTVTLPNTTSGTALTSYSIDLSDVDGANFTESTITITFRGKKSSSSTCYFRLDNVAVNYKPISAPTSLAAEATADGAVVTWVDDAEAGPWDLRYRVNGSSDDWTPVNSIATKTHTLTGLTQGTTYEVQVRTHASEHRISGWTASQTFTPVNCPVPTTLEATAITHNSATISWSGDAKAIRYKKGTDSWTNETISPAAETFDLSGLTPESTYTVQVKADCEESDNWSAELELATKCAPITVTKVAPYEADFTGLTDEMPGCWEKSETTYPYVTSEELKFYANEANQTAILPAFSNDIATLVLKFKYKNYSSLSGYGKLQVGYIDNAGDFQAVGSTLANKATYFETEINFEGVTGAKNMAIRFLDNSNAEAYSYVKDVVVELAPTCYAPASIADATSITAEGATISWTASGHGETLYQWTVVEGSATPAWVDDDAHKVDATSKTLTGLNPQTNYTFYVRSYCGASDQSAEVSKAFTTKCAAIPVADMPFEETFDGALGTCWRTYAATYYSVYVSSGELRTSAPKTTGNESVVVLPELAMPLNQLLVTFDYKGSNGTIEVGYVSNPENKTSFVAVGSAYTVATAYKHAATDFLSLGAVTGNVALRFKGNTGDGDFYVDNLHVAHGVALADADNNTATLAGLVGQTLEVTLGRTIYCDGDFNTLCLPFSLPTLAGTPLAGGELWSFRYGEVVGGELQIRIAPATSIEAGVPYLITFANGADIVNPTFTDVTITKSVGVSVGQTDDVQFIGILKPQAFVEEDKNNLFVASNGMLAWSNVGTGTALSNLRSFRGYFHTETAVSGTPVANNMPARIVKEEQTATGCENIQDNTVTIKIIENNQVVIIRNGVKYTVQGQVISK